MNQENEKQQPDRTKQLWWFVGVVVGLWLLAWVLLCVSFPSEQWERRWEPVVQGDRRWESSEQSPRRGQSGEQWERRGQFGDMFGAVNALFTGLAFAGVVAALFLQNDAVKEQREQMAKEWEVMKETREEQRKQMEEERRAMKETRDEQIAIIRTQALTATLTARTALVRMAYDDFPNLSARQGASPAFKERVFTKFDTYITDILSDIDKATSIAQAAYAPIFRDKIIEMAKKYATPFPDQDPPAQDG